LPITKRTRIVSYSSLMAWKNPFKNKNRTKGEKGWNLKE
jgi:hypothetical protein